MKKFFQFLVPFVFSSLLVAAQPTDRFTGTWEGLLDVRGTELRIVFHIKPAGNGTYISTADSPDQSAFGLTCDVTTVSGDSVTIEMKELFARYNGKWINDTTITGSFTQGMAFPLDLKKVDKPLERKRPQTPLPPFPYTSEEVSYSNPDKQIQFGATLTIPAGKGPFPALVMITGSGPQDRDETIMGHKLFAVLADHLTRNGIIVLRVDDRGVAKSTGDFAAATSADFANDVGAGLDYLLSRPEVNKKKLGLLGHSEGGMIAPMVATQRKDIDFLVLLAAPGVQIIDLMAEQNEAIAGASGVSPEARKEIQPLFRSVISIIRSANDSTTALARLDSLLENWRMNKKEGILEEFNLATPAQRKEYAVAMVTQFRSPWFRYFIEFSPNQYLEQLRAKVLALNGDKDIQVIASQNLPGIRRSLEKSRSKNYELKEMPGLNHLFQSCNKCTITEYAELEETISPAALKVISDWLEKNVK